MENNKEPYPIQNKNGKGWLRALLWLIAVAVIVTLVYVVVGIYHHHQDSLEQQEAVPAAEMVIPLE